MITCKFEDRGDAVRGLRHVTVGVIAVHENTQVLLVKRAANLHNGGKFAIPGGFLDRNENTSQGALRELKEETGYEGKVVSLFRVSDNPNRSKEDRQNVDFIYLVELSGGAPNSNTEVTNIHWFNKENLPEDEEFAFDHRDSILKYFQYLENKFLLPILG